MAHRKTIIKSNHLSKRYFLDIFEYRELFLIFTWRDFLVRYKQTFLGVLWCLLRPLATMLVLSYVFGRLCQLDQKIDFPYPIFVLCAALPWQFFTGGVSDASQSLIQNANMISKVFFPKIMIPLSSIAINLIDFLISFSLLILLCWWYAYLPSIKVLWLPIVALLLIMFAVGLSLLISSLNIRYRDFRYVVPFILQFGFFISPIGYSTDLIPSNYLWLYSLNPIVGVIDLFRWCLFESIPFPVLSASMSVIITFSLLVIGFLCFQKAEDRMADYL